MSDQKNGVSTNRITLILISPQPGDLGIETPERIAPYCTGAPEHGLSYYWRHDGLSHSRGRFYPPYNPGDQILAGSQMCRVTGVAAKQVGDLTEADLAAAGLNSFTTRAGWVHPASQRLAEFLAQQGVNRQANPWVWVVESTPLQEAVNA